MRQARWQFKLKAAIIRTNGQVGPKREEHNEQKPKLNKILTCQLWHHLMAWHLETFGFHLKSATCQLSRVAALVLALDGRLKRSSATRTNRIDGSLSRSQMKSGGKQLEGSTREGGGGGGGCAKESWGPEVEKRSAQKRNHKFNLIYFAAVLYWRWTNSRLSIQMAELSFDVIAACSLAFPPSFPHIFRLHSQP